MTTSALQKMVKKLEELLKSRKDCGDIEEARAKLEKEEQRTVAVK